MSFVPEGQHDSSQARSAGSHEKNSPVPAGRLNGSRLSLGLTMTSTVPPGPGGSLHRYQALRAWLRSACPSGTKAIRPSKGFALS
jgi:hypothetical protein